MRSELKPKYRGTHYLDGCIVVRYAMHGYKHFVLKCSKSTLHTAHCTLAAGKYSDSMNTACSHNLEISFAVESQGFCWFLTKLSTISHMVEDND